MFDKLGVKLAENPNIAIDCDTTNIYVLCRLWVVEISKKLNEKYHKGSDI